MMATELWLRGMSLPSTPRRLRPVQKRDRCMLEDDFCDILRKASRGTGLDAAALAARSGLPADHITEWQKGDGAPNDDEARALAKLLGLYSGKLADFSARRWASHGAPPGG